MTSSKDLLIDEQDAIAQAIASDDSETLFRIAQHIAKEGDEEYASEVRELGYKAEKNIWAHDEKADRWYWDEDTRG